MHPKLLDLRKNAKLSIGSKTVTIEGDDYEYTGEVDEDGKAMGHGLAMNKTRAYKGMFVDDKVEGIATCYGLSEEATCIKVCGEFRDGHKFGKSTTYTGVPIATRVFNQLVAHDGKLLLKHEIKSDRAFYKFGFVHKAIEDLRTKFYWDLDLG